MTLYPKSVKVLKRKIHGKNTRRKLLDIFILKG